jgi:hypothetical protein
MLPVSEVPATTPVKLHPCTTPVAVASRLTIASNRVPWIATFCPQLPLPMTLAVESVTDVSTTVIEIGVHVTCGCTRHPVHDPAIEKVSSMTGAVATVDLGAHAAAAAINDKAISAFVDRCIYPRRARLWVEKVLGNSADASSRASMFILARCCVGIPAAPH